MIYAILLLGLLPLAMFPDGRDIGPDDDEDAEDSGADTASVGSLLGDGDSEQPAENPEQNLWELGDAVDPLQSASEWLSDEPDIAIQPAIEDDVPDDGDQDTSNKDALQPIIEGDIITPSDGQEGDALEPVVDDDLATPSDGQEGGILDPVIEDDTAQETVWIEPEPGQSVYVIEDFQVGVDTLHITFTPDAVAEFAELGGGNDAELGNENGNWLNNDYGLDQAPGLLVRTSDDGLDSNVYIGGQLVAVLTGAPGASVANVLLEVSA